MNIIEFGDCRDIMRRWASEGVKAQTCVTSPPYYGLRDYGHEGQIGLEETPEEYISAMVEVFRCVRDVLADDGTVWLNIGDSYNASQANRSGQNGYNDGRTNRNKRFAVGVIEGLKPKDLVGIPWMLAFALRADGWYLRQDIIWHKPNPMPESVQDRCTKSHEYIFLLSKSQKYYFDYQSIKEDSINTPEQQEAKRNKKDHKGKSDPGGMRHTTGGFTKTGIYEKRNKRSVWTVTTKPYDGAHFAVFPTDLIEPCVLAGAPVGGIVLDPFMGSGTTAQVAQNLGRQYLGCELNDDYKPLQDQRLAQASLIL
ncbi:MAG: site-specific DNA-methyltransferase [Caulobacteraceae bacterium]|nr:site-specific DNA-methyltransferase [Caulobacteraceae bacterium]